MKKRFLPFLFFLLFISSKSYSQDFLGLTTGNYSGITGVSLQPASIVDSRFKFDMNLFSTGVNYGNNYFLLDRDVLLKFNKNKFDDYATFKDRYLSEASLTAGEKVFFNINNRTQIPLSFMATTGKKSAIALNMQFRTMVQGRGISQDFAKLGYNNFYYGPLNNATVDVSGISINSLSWAEAGFTYGRILYSTDKHFLKGAITGKYLAGLSSINISSNDLRLSVNNDSTFNFTTSNVSYNHNKNADFDKLFDKNFSPDASAFGFDAGLVYEYRGNIDKFKYLKTDDEKSYDALRRDVNKYIFKLGVSLVDAGMFKFRKPANVNSFQGTINNWNIRNAQFNSLKDFDTALANRVLPNLNDPRNYNVYLPSALSAQFDVKFVKGLFLNVMSYWPVSLGDEPGKRFDKFGYYTITPRFETRHFGLYIPYTVTQRNDLADYKQHLLGATVRLGPVFIGSSNLGSMLFNNELKSADVHVGLKVGFTYGKPNKSNRILRSVFKEEQPAGYSTLSENQEDQRAKTGFEKETQSAAKKADKFQTENSLLLDYKTGKVYDNPDVKQNITIINNYYYGFAPDQRIDTLALQRNYPVYKADNLQEEKKEMINLRNKVIADSLSRVTSDSLKIKRQQLDSLINSMQQLQRQMDSTSKAYIEDSPVSYNNLKMENRRQMDDSLYYRQDSLQTRRAETLMAGTSTQIQDSELVKEDSMEDKKKVKSVTDTLNSETNSRIKNSGGNDVTGSLSGAKEQELRRQERLIQLQDSVSELSQQYSYLTDSLTRKKNEMLLDSSDDRINSSSVKNSEQNSVERQELKRMQDSLNKIAKRSSELMQNASELKLAAQKENNSVLIPENRNAVATKGLPERRNEINSQENQRMQDMQDNLYKQYSKQADVLSQDIDRLNRRLVQERRDNRRNTNFIPVPVPVNNSGNSQRQKPVEVAARATPDTIYIRDSLMLTDTVRVTDTVNTMEANPVILKPAPTLSAEDTQGVKDVMEQSGFDYASLPEENILFSTGKSSIHQIYDTRLNFIADILKTNPGFQVHITGHTDSTGSKAINETLSLQRAKAVENYLLERGVALQQLKTTSQSFENPVVSGNSNAARSQNRRVALKLEKLESGNQSGNNRR